MRRAEGQATAELVALVPLLVAVAAAAFAVLAAGRASSAAGAAAEAGALAMLQGRDGAGAARRSLTGWPRRSTTVRVRGTTVRVTVRPALPLLGELLGATARSDAGRLPATPGALSHARGGDGVSASPRKSSR